MDLKKEIIQAHLKWRHSEDVITSHWSSYNILTNFFLLIDIVKTIPFTFTGETSTD